jgi:hypothetical protein
VHKLYGVLSASLHDPRVIPQLRWHHPAEGVPWDPVIVRPRLSREASVRA